MQPFSFATIKVLILLTVLSFGFYYVDFTLHPIVNIILKSILLSLIYLFLVYKFKLSKDINDQLKKYLPFL